MILKGLYDKLRVIKDFSSGKLHRKDIIKVGLFFDLRVYNIEYKSKFFIDCLPLVFEYCDPLSNRNLPDIDIYMTKFSSLMKYHKLNSDSKIQSAIKEISYKFTELEN